MEEPKPPIAPTTIQSLNKEMLGALDVSLKGLGLFQGTLRYWMMWRLPQLISAIQSTSGLRFHLCTASYKDLLQNLARMFLLPDLLVVGQCGLLFNYEMLQYEHPLEHQWPVVDETYEPGVSVISGKADRPFLHGLFPILDEWIRPLCSTGAITYTPYSTLLAAPQPSALSLDAVQTILSQAVSNAKPTGLPCEMTWAQRMERAKRELENNPTLKSVPLQSPSVPEDLGDRLLRKGKNRHGRIAISDDDIFQFDFSWQPADILAFEFYMSAISNTMFIVAGDWCEFVPRPGHELNLTIPNIEKADPIILANMIADDPDVFMSFRKTISTALLEALHARGSENFTNAINRIQAEIIDDGVATLYKRWEQLNRKRLKRLVFHTTKALPLAIGLYTEPSPSVIAGLFGTVAESIYTEIDKRRQETAEFKTDPMYFIWKIGR